MAKEYERAEEEIPAVFYENVLFLRLIAPAVVGVLVTLHQIETKQYMPDLMFSVASATTYVVGRIADTWSTVEVFKAVHKADELNVEHSIKEKNPFPWWPDKPTEQEVTSHKLNIPDYIGSSIAPLFPIAGMMWGVGSIFTMLNNKRVARRLDRAIEISTEK